ncbi:MAG: hypothetical protein ACOCQD_03255 [archaeon]
MSESKKKVSSENSTKLPFKIRLRSFFAGLKKKIKIKKSKIISLLKSKDFIAFSNSTMTILLNGFFITLPISYFIGFQWILIPITGGTWYILKKEVFPEIRQIVSSFNLVRIVK